MRIQLNFLLVFFGCIPCQDVVSGDDDWSKLERRLEADIQSNGWKEWSEMKNWPSVLAVNDTGLFGWQDLIKQRRNPISRFVAYRLISSGNPELQTDAAFQLLLVCETAVHRWFSKHALDHIRNLKPTQKNLAIFTKLLSENVGAKERLTIGSMVFDLSTEFLIEWTRRPRDSIIHSSNIGLVVGQLLDRGKGKPLPDDIRQELFETLKALQEREGFAKVVFLIYSDNKKTHLHDGLTALIKDDSITDEEFMLVISVNQLEVGIFKELLEQNESTASTATSQRRKNLIRSAIER